MPDLVSRAEVSLDAAFAVLAGIRAEAARRDVALAAVVCDLGGQVVAAQRMDGAQLAAMALAIDKAYTAVSFDHPTEAWAESTRPGAGDWGLSTVLGGRIVVFAGGLPLRREGKLVGGVGVSGSAADVDRACAVAGLRARGFDAV
ncbi:MAG: hypothetical protein AVDCRST_MAG38-913 [uncultured Solirubrobacteraceae bacterium]|uniref:Heme-binding protein n=1 Tax=uncultured Solirubrobacteraceae bacterium TaxID=1162706 RepID=A0A6J4RG62_9ACTN|nr:MAG: hypothetical protein AVDCRST_MAG38-913 [uncultured Solirubrobacteraceae bacterium]